MRVMRFAFAVSLSAGLALAAGNASAGSSSDPIFEGFWVITDSNEPNTVGCTLEMFSNNLDAFGQATGIGTAGAVVRIDFQANEPTNTSRNSKEGKVSQNQDSRLDVSFDGVSTTPGGIFPDKCKVEMKVNGNKGKGNGSANCKGGNLNSLLTDNEVASIQAAFVNSKRVKFKTNSNKQTWELSIKCDGTAINED